MKENTEKGEWTEAGILQVRHIKKSYKKKQVLQDVNFTVNQGECLGVIGGNGCGKSTLLSILAGMQKADEGNIIYQGENLAKRKNGFKDCVAYVPQTPPVIEDLSVYDNLRLWYASVNKVPDKELKQEITVRFGLDQVKDLPAGKLSGGMKKRLSIVCAMVAEAPVLVMDEPGAALDFPTKEDISNYVRDFTAKGGIVIISSHEEAELKLCNRILALVDGKAVPVEENAGKEGWMKFFT